MKNDVIQYERAYQLLKNKIESGILPVGAKLPGRSVLCRELGTSERTVRRALELLEQDGFLEIAPRKRPTVVSSVIPPQGRALRNMRNADAAQVDDLMETAALLCYPIYLRGLRLCTGGDWRTPEAILRKMDPSQPGEFWRLASRLWRFFIARNENELLLRAVEILGFRGTQPPCGSLEDRVEYRSHVETLFQTVKDGGSPGRAELDAIFSQYRAIAEQAGERQFLQALSPSPLLAEAEGLGQQLSLTRERYSTLCLDLLGLIATGRYQPGDNLPTHAQLQACYGVSRDTTVKAIRMLQDWGVVTAAPRRGISVVMDTEALKRIQITPESIACNARRYLDSLDLLSLTVGRVAAHTAACIVPESVGRLRMDIIRQWEHPFEHQLIPRTLLDFITAHIPYDALRAVYEVLSQNLRTGRSIPMLVSPDKTSTNCGIYQQCLDVTDTLLCGDADRLEAAAGALFARIRSLVVSGCRRLGYWDAAMAVYDGASLWQ